MKDGDIAYCRLSTEKRFSFLSRALIFLPEGCILTPEVCIWTPEVGISCQEWPILGDMAVLDSGGKGRKKQIYVEV